MTNEAPSRLAAADECARLWFYEGAHRIMLAAASKHDFEDMFHSFLDAVLDVFGCDRAGILYPCDAAVDSWAFSTIRERPGLPTTHSEAAGADAFASKASALFRASCSSPSPLRLSASEGAIEGAAAMFGTRYVLSTCVYPPGAPAAFLFALGDDREREEHPLESELFAEAARQLTSALTRLRDARALRESETRLAEAGRLAQLGYWEHDLLTNRVFWSDELYRILGRAPGSCPPSLETFLAQVHPDDRARRADLFERAYRNEARFDIIYRIVGASGEARTVHSVGDVVRNAAGKPYRMFGVMRDITEQKRAEQEITLVRQLLDHTNDGIEVIDPESGRFLDVNERACIAHGYTREEYLKLRVQDVEPWTPTMKSWGERTERLRQVGSLIAEGAHRRKDGSTFPVEVNVTYVRADRDYVLAIVRDITERKRLEGELRNAQKMEAVGRLAGGVAHDFNNLLTVVNNGTEMLLESLPREHVDIELLEDMLDAGLRGANLTRQLLAFSRTQSLEVEVIDLEATLRKVAHLLRRVIGEDIELSLRSKSALARVKVDAGQLENAILNLAVNARDAMPRGGTLVVETENVDAPASGRHRQAALPEGSWVCLRVMDSGHGIAEDDRTRVFDPFFTTKDPGRGTGLGLAMVYGFVKQSGGHIVLDTAVGRGTTFAIYLPRTDEPLPTRPRARTSSMAPRGTETVLLVEDEAGVRKLAKRALQHHGYEVIEAADGHAAMSLSREHRGAIDILVADVVMPRMSGTELAGVLTRERPDLRVLLMSGYSDAAKRVDAGVGAGGITAILSKPFRSKDLARTVRTVLDATSGTSIF